MTTSEEILNEILVELKKMNSRLKSIDSYSSNISSEIDTIRITDLDNIKRSLDSIDSHITNIDR
ncbi:MAG: hypothetical protein QM503_10655 [Bacteroidota bacterium]